VLRVSTPLSLLVLLIVPLVPFVPLILLLPPVPRPLRSSILSSVLVAWSGIIDLLPQIFELIKDAAAGETP